MATTITANGINFPDGSAGSPSIGGTDTNTGLFTGSDIVGFATGGSERLRIDASGNVNIANDSGQLRLGTDADLLVYHNGSDSYVKNSTGDLYIRDTNGNIFIQPKTDENAIKCVADGQVEIYYNNSKKFETTSNGVTLSGELNLVNNHLYANDNAKLRLGTGQDLELFHDGTDSFITGRANTRYLKIQAAETRMVNAANSEIVARFIEDGAVELYYDNSKKLETTANGATIDGGSNISMDSSGNGQLKVDGDGYSGAIALNGTAMNIYHNSGVRDIIFGINETEKVRLQAGGGISFNGDTAAANALSDYEEGTWSPEYNTGSASSAMFDSCSYSSTQGVYTKIGNLVTFSLRIQASNIVNSNSGSTVIITGLPFTSSSTQGSQGGGTYSYPEAVCSSNNGYLPTMHIGMSTTSMTFFKCNGNVYTVGDSNNDFTDTLHIQGQYTAA